MPCLGDRGGGGISYTVQGRLLFICCALLPYVKPTEVSHPAATTAFELSQAPGPRCGDALGQFCSGGESCCYRYDVPTRDIWLILQKHSSGAPPTTPAGLFSHPSPPSSSSSSEIRLGGEADFLSFDPTYHRVVTHCCPPSLPVCCGSSCCGSSSMCVSNCADSTRFCAPAAAPQSGGAAPATPFEMYGSASACAGVCCGMAGCCEKCCGGSTCLTSDASCCAEVFDLRYGDGALSEQQQIHRQRRAEAAAVSQTPMHTPPKTCRRPNGMCCGTSCCPDSTDCCAACGGDPYFSNTSQPVWGSGGSGGGVLPTALSAVLPAGLMLSGGGGAAGGVGAGGVPPPTPTTVCCGGCLCCDLAMSVCDPQKQTCTWRVNPVVLLLSNLFTLSSWAGVVVVLYFMMNGENILKAKRRRSVAQKRAARKFFFSPSSSAYSVLSHSSRMDSDGDEDSEPDFDEDEHEEIGPRCTQCHHPAHHKTTCHVGATNTSLSCLTCKKFCRKKTCHKERACGQQYTAQQGASKSGSTFSSTKSYDMLSFNNVNCVCPCPSCTCCTCMPILNCACSVCACPTCLPFYAHIPRHLFVLSLHAASLLAVSAFIWFRVSMTAYSISLFASAVYLATCLFLMARSRRRG